MRQESGSTKARHRSGEMLDGCEALQIAAVLFDPTAVVWRGSAELPHRRGMKLLGTPLGHTDFGLRPTLAKPTLAKPTLTNVKVVVVCKDFGFSELIVWVF